MHKIFEAFKVKQLAVSRCLIESQHIIIILARKKCKVSSSIDDAFNVSRINQKLIFAGR